jgi:hypothetical protein
MAVSGEELDTEALNNPPDDVRIVRETRIAAQLAQAMGRIRLRAMTREDGRCEPCDIFVRLPHWRYHVDPDRLMDLVRRTLPGAQVKFWEQATQKLRRDGRPPRARQDIHGALLGYAGRMEPGVTVKAANVKIELGVTSSGSWHRALVTAGTPGTALYGALAELGVSVRLGAGGRARPTVIGREFAPTGTDYLMTL